jgi:chromosome segregation ATPase
VDEIDRDITRRAEGIAKEDASTQTAMLKHQRDVELEFADEVTKDAEAARILVEAPLEAERINAAADQLVLPGPRERAYPVIIDDLKGQAEELFREGAALEDERKRIVGGPDGILELKARYHDIHDEIAKRKAVAGQLEAQIEKAGLTEEGRPAIPVLTRHLRETNDEIAAAEGLLGPIDETIRGLEHAAEERGEYLETLGRRVRLLETEAKLAEDRREAEINANIRENNELADELERVEERRQEAENRLALAGLRTPIEERRFAASLVVPNRRWASKEAQRRRIEAQLSSLAAKTAGGPEPVVELHVEEKKEAEPLSGAAAEFAAVEAAPPTARREIPGASPVEQFANANYAKVAGATSAYMSIPEIIAEYKSFTGMPYSPWNPGAQSKSPFSRRQVVDSLMARPSSDPEVDRLTRDVPPEFRLHILRMTKFIGPAAPLPKSVAPLPAPKPAQAPSKKAK